MPMKNHLQQLGANTWIFPQDPGKDRPNLGYVRGEKMALAIDAGHSSSHVEDFYDALDREGLPLPDLTVITHWHWDHTYGMHAVHGRTIARPETNRHLLEIAERLEKDPGYGKKFLKSDPCIIREYAGGVPLKVVPADEELQGDRTIDLGIPNRPTRKMPFSCLCPGTVSSLSETPSWASSRPGTWTLTKWPCSKTRSAGLTPGQ